MIMTYMFIEVIHIRYGCGNVWMTRVKIVKEKYSAVFNSAVADKNRRIAEIKTPQKLLAIRYLESHVIWIFKYTCTRRMFSQSELL